MSIRKSPGIIPRAFKMLICGGVTTIEGLTAHRRNC
nr:MAG TPA: hypothetical protein [Caudoviricetes sp.]